MQFFIILPYIICCCVVPRLLVVGRKEHQQRRKIDHAYHVLQAVKNYREHRISFDQFLRDYQKYSSENGIGSPSHDDMANYTGVYQQLVEYYFDRLESRRAFNESGIPIASGYFGRGHISYDDLASGRSHIFGENKYEIPNNFYNSAAERVKEVVDFYSHGRVIPNIRYFVRLPGTEEIEDNRPKEGIARLPIDPKKIKPVNSFN